MRTLLFDLQALCMDLPRKPEGSTCMSATDGRPAMPMSCLLYTSILAKALTRDKRKAIIINADMNVPMLPVWLPEQIIQTNTSIGQMCIRDSL